MKPTMLNWVYLFVAGVLEIAWAISMKYSEGLTKLWPTLAAYGLGFASFYFLALAAEHLPIGTAYAIWTGVGAVGTAILGMMLFSEPRHWLRLLSILFIVVGIVGLHLTAHK